MSTLNRRSYFVPKPGAAAPRQPIDRAKIGRSSVRRRATGMNPAEAAAALEQAQLLQHLDRNREDLADDERGPAEIAEWERIAQLLATTGGRYSPEADAVVQEELDAEAEAAADAEDDRWMEMEQQRQEQLHDNGLPERAHMLMALVRAGLIGGAGGAAWGHGVEGPLVLHEPEDLYALDYLNEYGEFHQMFRILEGCGMTPPRDLEAVPASVRAHSALLRAMARAGTVEGFDTGHAVRLAQADPNAVLALAAWIETRGRSSQ